MTEQETREAMKMHGWSFLRRKRNSRFYVYAARKVQGKRKELYVCPLSVLEDLTIDDLVNRLCRK